MVSNGAPWSSFLYGGWTRNGRNVPQTDGRAVGDGALLLSRMVSRDSGGFAPCAPRDNVGKRDAKSLAWSSLEMSAQAAAIAPELIANVAEEDFPGWWKPSGRVAFSAAETVPLHHRRR